jgi:protein involved in polysaccharide export with SLBB domain
MMRLPILLVLLCAGLLVSVVTAHAQTRVALDPQGLKMERAELEEFHEHLQAVTASTAYSGRIRDRAQRDAEVIRTRLERGDFRVGDRILLQVEGEANIPEELPVQPGPSIRLPVMGTISLAGVLRSELEEHLTRELGRFMQNPVVRAESLVRISIQGEVGRPGFYTVPADMLLQEAIMHAGGPGRNADLDRIRIERTGERLWGGDELRHVLAEGQTLDQLNVQAGDQIVVAARGQSPWRRVARTGLTIASVVLLGTRITRVLF